MTVRLTVNTAKCQSYRRCMAVAPAVFTIDEAGKARAVHSADSPPEQMVQAAKSCPYRAITAVDDESGQQLFPPPRRSDGEAG